MWDDPCYPLLLNCVVTVLLDMNILFHCQDLKPHIFAVAEQTYRNVQKQMDPVNQSIIVSGESGAGKVRKWFFMTLLSRFEFCQWFVVQNSAVNEQRGIKNPSDRARSQSAQHGSLEMCVKH